MAYDDTIKKTLPMIKSTFGSFLQNLFGGQLPSIQPQVAMNAGGESPAALDLGTGRTPPPIVPGSVGLQAAPPIADTSTAPPPPINAIPNTPEFQMYQTQQGTAPPPTPLPQPLPIIQQGNAPDSPELQQRLAAQDYAPAITTPDQPTPVTRGGASTFTNDFAKPIPSIVQSAATPVAATPQTDEEKYNATYRSYGRGTWKLDDGSITHDPKKYAADIKAHPDSTVREVKEEPGADRKKKWSIWEKLGNAALGWAQGGIVGGVQGATDRNWWRKQQDAATRADLLPKIQAQQKMRLENAKIAAQLDKPGQEKAKTDALLKIALDNQNRLKGTATLVTNPDTGRKEYTFPGDPTRKAIAQISSTGEEVYDPEFKRTDYVDPRTHKTLSLKESDAANKNLQIATQDAAHQQTMETTNVKAVNDANIQFLKDQADYRQGVLKRMDEAVKAQAGMLSNESKVRGLEQKIGGLVKQINDAEAAGPTYDPAETKRREELWKQANDAQADMNTALAATVEGRAMLDQLKSQGLTPPKRYIPEKITAVKIGGERMISKEQLQQFANSQNPPWSIGRAEAYAKNNKWTIQ